MKRFGPAVARIGISVIVLWFGSQQLLHPTMWVRLVPNWALQISHLSALTVVTLNGWLEITLGLLLILGFYSRIVGFLLFLHILNIAFTLGYNSIGVRDFGLSIMALSVSLNGPDGWCLDTIFDKKNNPPRMDISQIS